MVLEEEWKDVVGYENLFQVSNKGHLFSKRTNKILSQFITKKGYCVVSTRFGGRKGKNKVFRMHVLVAQAFLNNPNNYPIVNHKDSNKQNNNVNNLEWCTHQQNTLHAIAAGTVNGTRMAELSKLSRKLSFEQIKEFKENYIPLDRQYGMRSFARKFGVAHNCLSEILHGKSYLD